VWTTTVTQFNPHGTELENKDKLGRYSSEITGYYDQLVTGVAANSRYRQIAFEGFEDFAYNATLDSLTNCEIPRHFGHDIRNDDVLKDTYHTGNYALKVGKGNSIETKYDLVENCPTGKHERQSFKIRKSPRENLRESTMDLFELNSCECIQSFSPDPGKYVVTAWVKEGDGLGQINYQNHKLNVKTTSSSVNFKANGKIIDGWQRVEGVFEVKPADREIAIGFIALGKNVFFDDLRIFPFDGDMKNYVYHDVSLKLLSEIDANGFANFYEYNAAGELIRIKKETERGIMTIQESRSAQPKL
jgi:hypothetical protein